MNGRERANLIMRKIWIGLACDADYRTLSAGRSMAARRTIAEALEVLDD